MRFALTLTLILAPPGAQLRAQTVHHLKASAQTVVVGYYDASTSPALRVKSGDIVEMDTLGVTTPEGLRRVGMHDNEMQPALLEVAAANPGRRGHFLTGPVYVEGAEPGDVLEVQIRKVTLAVPYAVNGMGQNGVLADPFAQGGSRLIPLDLKRNVAHFATGVEIPLQPF